MNKPENIEGRSDSTTLFALLRQLFSHISARRKFQFLLLVGLTIISSLAEVVSLGAIIPFIGILTQPEIVFNYPEISGVIQMMGITSANQLVLPLTILFATAAFVAGGLRLVLLWVSIRLVNATGADLSVDVYNKTLYQPYSVHVLRSSSEIISSITQKVTTATSVLISIVTVATSTALFVAILTTLLLIDPLVATVAVISFGISYGLIAWMTRHRLKENSQTIASQQTHVVKSLQEGLGAIRDIILDDTQSVYCETYRKAIIRLQKANGENRYINQAPRYAMESLGMILIAALAYALSYQEGGIEAALPVLGALALGAQRLLPLLQQLYGNWVVVMGSRASLMDVLDLLDQPLEEDFNVPEPFNFKTEICFDNLSFKYGENEPCVLDQIDLTIKKGMRVGFIGTTGSGKSTMLDLLMSLLTPTQGNVVVDGKPISKNLQRSWRSTIAHVPQNIFLSDSTVAENIAFGIPYEQIDFDRVKEAAKLAHIAEFIESRPKGYQTDVGECGIRLSGGQRQRIGIARALYKQAEVLIFDEATSALDTHTEKSVMKAIESLKSELTILIIAHRITTLQQCDTIVKLERGKIVAQGSYDNFI